VSITQYEVSGLVDHILVLTKNGFKIIDVLDPEILRQGPISHNHFHNIIYAKSGQKVHFGVKHNSAMCSGLSCFFSLADRESRE
jgi:hypothetical protein